MRRYSTFLFVIFIMILLAILAMAQGQKGAPTAALIPGEKGGQDMFGGYDVVKGWPNDISTVPGNEKWTFGAGQAVYAESPNRALMLFRGELPKIKRRSEEHR